MASILSRPQCVNGEVNKQSFSNPNLSLILTVFYVSAVLDIPIYKSKIQSLHVLFTLYSEFKNSQVRRSCARVYSIRTGWLVLTPLHAKFFRGNKNIYVHFMSFLQIDMTQVIETLPQVRQELAYCT